MKKLITEVDDGLESLLGERVLLMCGNYFYTGLLAGVNATCVLLEDPEIVYETGSWNEKGYKDAQQLPAKNWYVQTAAIESFGVPE